METLGDKITIIPVFDIRSVNINNIDLINDMRKRDIYLNHNIDFVSASSISEAGKVYNNSLKCYSDSFDGYKMFGNQLVIVQLYTLDGKVYNWGSKDYPVRCMITAIGSRLEIQLSSTTLSPVIP